MAGQLPESAAGHVRGGEYPMPTERATEGMAMMNRKSMIGIALLGIMLLGTSGIQAEQDGITNVLGGCACHSPTAEPSVTVTLTGLPETYDPGEVYNLTITIVGGPEAHSGGNNSLGGFNIIATGGTFSSVDEKTSALSKEMTHTELGNDQREWNATWTAPPGSNAIHFTLHGNSVNGDGNNTNEDMWNKAEYTSFSSQTPAQEEATPGFLTAATMISIIGACLMAQRQQ